MTNFALKLIAMFTMFIDHIGFTLLSDYHSLYIIFRAIGRISFPIFIFLVSEGLIHTRNKKKYFKRLLSFAIISEVPYDFCFFYNREFSLKYNVSNFLQSQNIYFTLALGVLFVIVINDFKKNKLIYNFFVLSVLVAVSFLIRSDYGFLGIIFIPCMYYSKIYTPTYIKHPRLMVMFLFMFLIAYDLPSSLFLASFIPIPIIYFYNNEIGLSSNKLFYYFYPVHLSILFILSNFYILNFVI